MAAPTTEVKERTTRTGNTVEKTTQVKDGTIAEERAASTAERVVWLIAGIILALLAFRFVLSLLGANPDNGFASLIYSLSYPFVAPFFGLFGYDNAYTGVGRFEVYTLVAMAVYAFLAWIVARIVTINH